jgi:hypothetical protein
MDRFWERAKPLLTVCILWGLLVEGVGSSRAGHLMNADEFVAAEDAALYAAMDGVYWLVTFGTGKKGEWR